MLIAETVMVLWNIFIGCGHCKALIPTYEEVATTFKNDEHVSTYTFHKYLTTCTCACIYTMYMYFFPRKHWWQAGT